MHILEILRVGELESWRVEDPNFGILGFEYEMNGVK
jgi:hypothetical protein